MSKQAFSKWDIYTKFITPVAQQTGIFIPKFVQSTRSVMAACLTALQKTVIEAGG